MKRLTIILTALFLFVGSAAMAQSSTEKQPREKPRVSQSKIKAQKQRKDAGEKRAEMSKRGKVKKEMIERYGSKEAAQEAAREKRRERRESLRPSHRVGNANPFRSPPDRR